MTRSRAFLRTLLFPVAITLFMASPACGGDDSNNAEDPTTVTPPRQSTVSGDITVFAASSLTEAFTEIGEAFEETHSDAGVVFNFDGSQALRTQLEQGARADIFASANKTQRDAAVESRVARSDTSVFARNRLVVIVPADNPADIETLQDLADPGTKLVLANEDVPVGTYSRQFLDKASADPAFSPTYRDDVLANLVSDESNVRQVAAKVQLGEADAGIVYTSDVTPDLADDVETIEILDALNELATYPMAVTAEAANPEAAEAYIDFVLSEEGQAILAKHGFLPAMP